MTLFTCFYCGAGIEDDDKEGVKGFDDSEDFKCGRCRENPAWYMRHVPRHLKFTVIKGGQ